MSRRKCHDCEALRARLEALIDSLAGATVSPQCLWNAAMAQRLLDQQRGIMWPAPPVEKP